MTATPTSMTTETQRVRAEEQSCGRTRVAFMEPRPLSELRCMAHHPGVRRHPERFRGKQHRALLGTVAAAVRFTGNVYPPGGEPGSSWNAADDERVYLRLPCPSHDCRHVTEYEIVVPDALQRAG